MEEASAPEPIPTSVAELLRTFQDSREGLSLRLWGSAAEAEDPADGRDTPDEGGDGRVLLFPPDPTTPPPRVTRRIDIELTGGDLLELEAAGAEISAEELRFLGSVVVRLMRYEREARLAAGELTERYEEINLLYSISEILGSVISMRSAAERILAEVADVLGARRASLWLFDPDQDDLRQIAGVGESRPASDPIPLEDPSSLTARVFREKQLLNLEKGSVLPRGAQLEPRPHGLDAVLAVPITYSPPEGSARTVGVIALVGRKTNVRFSAGDSRLLSAIASQVGAALEAQRLIQESLRQERMVHELELAHHLQLKLLPDVDEFEESAEVAARCEPADSVGGDFYQLFRLSEDRLGIVIGDVSSHGFSAALIMALTMSAVAIYAQEAGPPGEVLRRVHRALIDELESTEMYMTMFYGVLNPSEGRVIYANAGHPYAFRMGPDGATHRLGANNPPLGMVTRDSYEEDTAEWRAGSDLLCLFTDGLSDAFASDGGPGGESGLLDEVRAVRDQPVRDILGRLFERARGSRLDIPADDRTALLLRQ